MNDLTIKHDPNITDIDMGYKPPVDQVSMSPVPKKNKVIMSFDQAIKEVIAGKKIRRLEWPAEEYGALVDGWLIVRRQGVNHRWLISDGDLLAVDWITVEVN